MVRGIPNISVVPVGYSMAQGGKMSLPVDPSALIYSNFEHVSGIAAPKGTQGASISKLNLLDVLIGQLNQIKKGTVAPESARGSSAENFDLLIENYKTQIKQAKAANAAMPYLRNPSAPGGAVLKLTI